MKRELCERCGRNTNAPEYDWSEMWEIGCELRTEANINGIETLDQLDQRILTDLHLCTECYKEIKPDMI